MILAILRGFLIDWLTSGSTAGVEAGLSRPLARALDREEAAGNLIRVDFFCEPRWFTSSAEK